jgi:hypothetical protein
MDALLVPSYSSHIQSGSGSDSEGDMSVPLEEKKSGNVGIVDRSGCSKDSIHTASLYDRPQFSLRHVKLICERLLNEQALQLRYEYETALNKKLEGGTHTMSDKRDCWM